MRPPPFGVTLPVFADHNSEANAGLSVALIAELMETDHLRQSG
jgi:hypothetical protein